MLLRTAAVVVVFLSAACSETAASGTDRSCRFSEQDLIGGWSSPVEDSEVVKSDSRELDFEVADGARVVREYLHHRLMPAGTWTLEGCSVTITLGGGSGEEFRLQGDAEPILVGNQDDPEYRTVYSKIGRPAKAHRARNSSISKR